jgi:hypothetical protein
MNLLVNKCTKSCPRYGDDKQEAVERRVDKSLPVLLAQYKVVAAADEANVVHNVLFCSDKNGVSTLLKISTKKN